MLSGRTITVCGGGFSAEIAGNSGEIWVPENGNPKIEVDEVVEEIIEEITEEITTNEPVAEEKSITENKELNLNKPYEDMSIEELQASILAKMAKNGPVTEDMKRSVIVNTHQGSLLNWVRSFN